MQQLLPGTSSAGTSSALISSRELSGSLHIPSGQTKGADSGTRATDIEQAKCVQQLPQRRMRFTFPPNTFDSLEMRLLYVDVPCQEYYLRTHEDIFERAID